MVSEKARKSILRANVNCKKGEGGRRGRQVDRLLATREGKKRGVGRRRGVPLE